MDIFERILKSSQLYDDNNLKNLIDSGQVTTASNINRPEPKESVREIDLFNDFMKRNPKSNGGMLVKPSTDGSRPGYRKDDPGSLYKQKNGYVVQFGDSKSENRIFKYFGPQEYGSTAKAKKAAEKFKTETGKTWKPQQTNPGIKQATAEKAIQELLDEGTEITTKNILNKIPKKIIKEGVSDTVLNKAKKKFPNLDFKKSPRVFLKTPKEIARVSKLIEDGLPLKEIQAKGFDVKFIKRVAKVNNLKIAETSYDYYENVKKITKDLTKIGKNKKIVEAFENGTVSKDLISQVGKVTKSNDPFYDSRLLFKLAEYYDGSLEEWYKPKLPKPTSNQITNSDKVIKSSATFLGGKRNGYAYQNFLYDWGAKKIDKVLDLPLGTFRGIQRDIANTLPSGVSLDEVFGVKSSGRFSPIEGILTNPLESGANVDKGSFVDNVKSNYQKQLVEAAGDPKKQKEILKEYNDVVQKSKVRYPEVEFPNYKVGQPPNKTIKGFDKLPPLIQNKLLENYEKTKISPVTKKATSIFDVAKATGSKTFEKLDKDVQANLSNISSNEEKKILQNITSYSKLPQCKIGKADGGRIGFALSDECIRDGLLEQKKAAAGGNKKAAQELVQTAAIASRGRLLKNVLGPGAILSEAVFEGAVIGNKVLGGKPLDQAWAESYLSYLDPRKYRGELDPMLMERDRMLKSTADKDILRSGFAAQDQLSAFNKALQDRELAKARGRTDQYNIAAEDVREQGRLADQSARVISDESFQDASRTAQEYIQGLTGTQMGKYKIPSLGQYESGLDRRIRGEREKEMQSLYEPFTEQDVSKMIMESGYDPNLVLNKRKTERLTPTLAVTSTGLERILSELQRQQAFQNIADAGGVANLANGGIAGAKSGPAPESGPTPHGLPNLFKRVRNY